MGPPQGGAGEAGGGQTGKIWVCGVVVGFGWEVGRVVGGNVERPAGRSSSRSGSCFNGAVAHPSLLEDEEQRIKNEPKERAAGTTCRPASALAIGSLPRTGRTAEPLGNMPQHTSSDPGTDDFFSSVQQKRDSFRSAAF